MQYFLKSLKIDSPINFPFIPKIFHSFNNESNIIDNSFINKKTKRNEKKNEINQEIKEFEKNRIFLIKKIKDKNKEIEEDRKRIKKIFYRRSKFRGVSMKGKSWQAIIMIDRNKKYIGNFETEEEAAKAYDEYAMKFHKNKARLNFPHKGYLSI